MSAAIETPTKTASLGIVGYDSYEFIVTDLERSRRFYRQMLDVPEIGRLSDSEAARRGETAYLFKAGKALFSCVTPRERGSRADRWLKRHPDGIAVLGLRVRDLDHTRRVLERRCATFCTDIHAFADQSGAPYRYFEIASPLGDVRVRFVERQAGGVPPGFELSGDGSEQNRFQFQVIDHITSNFLTIEPHITWLRDVLGFEEYWRVHFHTADVRREAHDGGSGLASIVMWDPESGIKLANNEPVTPNYERSQIYTFCEQNFGPGVQHVAFHVPQIIPTVEGLRSRGVEFLQTPATYYDMLPARLAERRVRNLREREDELRRLQILVDGENDKYLLQIFMVEGGVLYGDADAGPFFYEVIQRCGARSFGEGNFRALFEAIERDQNARGAVERQLDAGAGS
jgi:4-hydroxyphenylpyruvate dioxygenase